MHVHSCLLCGCVLRCGTRRAGPRLRVSGELYHPDCFTCTACHQPFPTPKFSIKDGKPFHAECVPKAPVVPCTACHCDIGCVSALSRTLLCRRLLTDVLCVASRLQRRAALDGRRAALPPKLLCVQEVSPAVPDEPVPGQRRRAVPPQLRPGHDRRQVRQVPPRDRVRSIMCWTVHAVAMARDTLVLVLTEYLLMRMSAASGRA